MKKIDKSISCRFIISVLLFLSIFSCIFFTPGSKHASAATLANIAYQIAESSKYQGDESGNPVDINLRPETICKSDIDCNDNDESTKDFCSPYGLECLHSTNSNCVDFDLRCPAGCENVDIDCFENMTARHLPIKEYTDYSNIIYIDPETGVEGNDGLSPETALPTWEKVHFVAHTAYVQKRGTIDIIGESAIVPVDPNDPDGEKKVLDNVGHLEPISKDDILIGAYGTGPLPTIHKSVQNKGRFFNISANYATVRDLNIITEGSSTLASIYSSSKALKYATIFNIHGKSTGQYTRFENGFSIGEYQGSGGHRVLYSSVDGVGNDGFFSKANYYLEIGYTSIKNVNLRYFDGQDGGFELQPIDVSDTCVYTDQCYAAGDGLQFTNPIYGLHVHHNVIDKSTPNKHTIMLKGGSNKYGNTLDLPDDYALIEDNYFITSKYAAGINAEARPEENIFGVKHKAAANFFLVVKNNLFEYVRTDPDEFDPDNNAEGVAYFSHVFHQEVYNNIFLGYKDAIKASISNGDGNVSNSIKIYNNYFLNIAEAALNLSGYIHSDIQNNYFALDPGCSTYKFFPPSANSTFNMFSSSEFLPQNEGEQSIVADLLLGDTFNPSTSSPAKNGGNSDILNQLSIFPEKPIFPETSFSYFDLAGKKYSEDSIDIGPFQ